MRCAVASLVVALVGVASMAGCGADSRYRVLAFLFEEVPPPGEDVPAVPVVRSPRHPRQSTPTPTSTEGAPAALTKEPAAFKTWDDVVRLLPRDQVGNPDWVGALAEKVIAPRPGIAPEAVEPEVLALDVEIVPKSDPAFKVTFSHQKHGEWLACSNCHTDMFEMKAGATPMAAQDVHAERYCAACHGKVAFNVVTGCLLCHLRNLPKDAGGSVDWNRAVTEKLITPRAGPGSKSVDQPILDLDVELKPEAQPALKGVFSHTTHTKWLACANCHPSIFPTGPVPANVKAADLHSRRYCGACHGSVAFGMIGFCGRCHPALEKARQHQEVLDLDVEITPKSQPSVKTTFSHKTHRWVECPSCHTNLFEKTAEAAKMTMPDIYGGKYCAVCHGKVAFDLITQCQRCHGAGDAK
ncbi:MAG: c(7)-type cytochrome triheme domain-containing protein [Candidatus Binatia bacterium]